MLLIAETKQLLASHQKENEDNEGILCDNRE